MQRRMKIPFSQVSRTSPAKPNGRLSGRDIDWSECSSRFELDCSAPSGYAAFCAGIHSRDRDSLRTHNWFVSLPKKNVFSVIHASGKRRKILPGNPAPHPLVSCSTQSPCCALPGFILLIPFFDHPESRQWFDDATSWNIPNELQAQVLQTRTEELQTEGQPAPLTPQVNARKLLSSKSLKNARVSRLPPDVALRMERS